jgi:hypothetical protein
MTIPPVSTTLSGFALLVSVGLLIVHYRNQVERRHGELIQLRTQILSDLSSFRQRLISMQMNGEMLRLELRRIPDSEDKYRSIEKLPSILKSNSETSQVVEDITAKIEKMNMQKMNRTTTLIRLQELASDVEKILPKVQWAEEEMLALLRDVRKQIEV